MKQKESNLVSKAGLIFLLVLILVASYFRTSYLRIFLFLLLLLSLASFLWAKKASEQVEFSLEGENGSQKSGVFPGSKTKLRFTVKNTGALPIIWLKILLPFGEKAALKREDGKEEENFAWIMPGQSLSYEEKLLAVRRGIFTSEKLEAVSGDGFGLKEKKFVLSMEKSISIAVFPKIIPVKISSVMSLMTELEEKNQGLYKDPTLIRNVRPYQAGDQAKDINWRQLAKEGKLSVNVREKEDYRRLSFYLDLESFVRIEESFDQDGTLRKKRVFDEVGMEEMLSLTASLIKAFSKQQIFCGLILPRYGEKGSRILTAGKKENPTFRMLTALSAITYQGEKTELPIRQIRQKKHELGPIFILAAGENQRTEFLKNEREVLFYSLFREEGEKKKGKGELSWREVIPYEA
jgi:uncharacterized protein (DUF58 family)